MDSLHHRQIKKFSIDGIISSDHLIERLRGEYIKLLLLEMKLSGYARRIDIDPDFTISYNHIKNYYEFELTMYGVHVGKKKAEWIHGIDGTTIYTQQIKSKEYSQDQA